MAETRPILRSKNKSIDIREALEFIENPETRAVTNLPIRPQGGEIYLFQGNKNTKEDWKGTSYL